MYSINSLGSMTNEWRLDRKLRTLLFISLTHILVIIIQIPSSMAVYDLGDIKCTDTLEKFKLSRNNEVTAKCPPSCADGYCKVIGSGPYTASSSVCCTAIHNGTLINEEGGDVIVKITHRLIPHFIGSTRHDVKSRNEFQQSTVTFITKRIHVETTRTTSTTLPATSSPATPISTPTMTDEQLIGNERKTENVEIEDGKDEEKDPIEDEKKQNEKSEDKDSYGNLKNQNDDDEDLYKTTQSLTTTESLTTTSRSTPISHKKAFIAEVTVSTTADQNPNLIRLPGYLLAICIIFSFASGAITTWLCVCLRRRAKHAETGRPNGRPIISRKGKSRSACEEGEICVCYENLSSSKQGLLLYDPETCNRPCPIRSPPEDGSLLDDGTMTKSFNLTKSFDQCGKSSGELKKCGVRYEEECCKSACSGACKPDQYEF